MTKLKSKKTKKRPLLVWIISWLTIFAAVFTGLSLYAIYSGQVEIPAEEAAYLSRMSSLQKVSSLMILIANFLGGLYLFQLRKEAFHLFAGAFIINIVSFFYELITGKIGHDLGLELILPFSVGLGICWYIYRLIQKKIIS